MGCFCPLNRSEPCRLSSDNHIDLHTWSLPRHFRDYARFLLVRSTSKQQIFSNGRRKYLFVMIIQFSWDLGSATKPTRSTHSIEMSIYPSIWKVFLCSFGRNYAASMCLHMQFVGAYSDSSPSTSQRVNCWLWTRVTHRGFIEDWISIILVNRHHYHTLSVIWMPNCRTTPSSLFWSLFVLRSTELQEK